MSSIYCADNPLENNSYGMFRLLPWSSPGVGANKAMAEDLKMLVASKQRKSPVLDGPAIQPKLKRKRGDSSDQAVVLAGNVVAKSRVSDYEGNHQKPASARLPSNGSADTPHATPAKKTRRSRSLTEYSATPRSDLPRVNGPTLVPTKMDIDQLCQTFDAELSFEVLLKHNELRLIEQEIAKCQVALEQLRRCAEIPYPGSSVTGLSASVSDGTGMAVQAGTNNQPPTSPAPWGVTDGPYTRHYAKWLLPDPHFDGGEVHSGASLLSPTNHGPLDCRPTRAEAGYVAGKSRSQRGSANARLQALSSGYPPPKDKAGPMIIKRKNDGQLVKLVCLDCRRDNFSSTQGFINHCRIAHNRNFASHDAAAMASGEPVEINEAGVVVGGSSDPSNSTGAGYVHPLIRSAHMVESMSRANIQRWPSSDGQTVSHSSNSQSSPTVESQSRPKKPKLSPPTTPATSFKASSDIPHLSSLLERRGIRLDLQQIVGDAKTTIDLAAYSSEEGSEDEATGARIEPHLDRLQLSVHGGRQPTRTTMSQAASQRPTSRKGFEKANHKLRHLRTSEPTKITPYSPPYAPPLAPAANSQLDRAPDIDMAVDSSENSSPHIMESNQAPSLVSDDDEYEAPSESESPSPSSSEAGSDQDFDHIEVEDDEGAATSTTTTDAKTDPGLTSPTKPQARSLSKPLKRNNNNERRSRVVSSPLIMLTRSKDDRRVSLVSPNLTPTKSKRDTGRRHHQR